MKLKTVAVLLLVVCSVSMGYAQNLLPNPGFEDNGGSGEWASTPMNWNSYGSAGSVEGWAQQPDTPGSQGCALHGWVPGGWAGLYAEIPIDLSNGSEFTLNVNLKCEENFTSTGQELYMKLEFWSGGPGGTNVKTIESNIYSRAKSIGTNWNTYTIIHTNTDMSIDTIKAVIGGGGFQDQHTQGQAVMFDNVSMTQAETAVSLTITNPTAPTVEVSNDVMNATVQGTSELALGDITWTNSLTGASGSVTAGDTWSIPAIALNVGVNVITVNATNDASSVDRTVTVTRHAQLPELTITQPAGSTSVGALISSYEVAGTCNGNTAGVTWDNGRGSTGTATIYGGATWTATVALAFGDNNIAVTGTNVTGATAQDTVLINRQTDPPGIAITYPSGDTTVTNGILTYAFYGGCYNGAEGDVTWTNGLTGASGTVPVTASWEILGVALDVGDNLFTVSCSNGNGEVATDSLTVTREDGEPFIEIDVPGGDISVTNGVLDYTILGTVNASVYGIITITNRETGEFRVKPKPLMGGWSFTNMVLVEGTNFITVLASNTTGQISVDTVTIFRDFAEGKVWINEMHYVNIGPTDDNEGIEIAGEAGSVLDQHTLYLYDARGLVYNTRALSGEIDDETNGYGAVWFDYGVDVISNGPNCGVALTFKTNVIEFISWRGQVTAVDGPAMGETSTDIGVTETRFTPLYYSLQKQGFGLSDTSFVWGGPYINSYSNINYGQLMSGDSDDNGIPDNWQNFYFPPPTTVDPNDDQDGDEYSNIEEFRADTNPLMSNQYPQVVEFVVSQGTSTVSFYSSKDRSYLFEVSTNLADGSWTNMQPAFMGIKTGEYFTISYPEVLKRGNFRYSVTMPGTE